MVIKSAKLCKTTAWFDMPAKVQVRTGKHGKGAEKIMETSRPV